MDTATACLPRRPTLGRDELLEGVYRSDDGLLLTVARRMLPSEEDARDALQQAFLLALGAFPRFEGRSNVHTWLHRIVVNACLMKLRSTTACREQSLEPLGLAPPSRNPQADPSIALASREVQRAVAAGIEALPGPHRAVLLMRTIEGHDTVTTARLLGTTPGAVRVRLSRARRLLRARLGSIAEEIDDC